MTSLTLAPLFLPRLDAARPLRRLGWLAAGVGALALAGVLALLLVNRFDQPLDPATEAWLAYRFSEAAPERNGYLAMISLDAASERPLEAAAAAVASYREIAAANPGRGAAQRYQAAQQHWLPALADRLPDLRRYNDTLYPRLLEDRAALAKLRREHAPLLERYRAMLALPEYAEALPLDIGLPLPRYAPAQQLGTLYLSEVADLLERGEVADAYRRWADYQRFWHRAASGSRTLVNLMVAAAALNRGHTLLDGMLSRHPDSGEAARQWAGPALGGAEPMRNALARSLIAEFRIQASSFDNLLNQSPDEEAGSAYFPDEPNRSVFQLASWLVQRNGTLNMVRRVQEQSLREPGASLEDCDSLGDFLTLLNPIGHLVVCINDTDYEGFSRRTEQVEREAARLRTRLAGLVS